MHVDAAEGMSGEAGKSPTPLRHPPFLRYLAGLLADVMGDQIWFIALAWAAARATDTATAGLIVAAGTVPRMLALLHAGVVVDRLGALRVAQAAQAIRVVTMLAAVLAAITSVPPVWLLVTLALVFGLADAMRLPASGALLPALLPADDLPVGQGLVSTGNRIASVLAGPAGGIALAMGGFSAAAGVNIALFTLAMLIFVTLRHRLGVAPPPAPEGERGVFAGLRYVVRHRTILMMLTVTTGLNLALVGPLNLGVVLHVEKQQWSPTSLGLIMGVFGAAAALGALSLSIYRPRRQQGRIGFLWSTTSAVAIMALGYAPGVLGVAAAAAIAGFALGPAGALLLGTVQATTQPEYLGRVMSLISFSSFGLTPIGLAGFGYIADSIGLPLAFLSAGGVVAVLSLAAAFTPVSHESPAPTPEAPSEMESA
ncbi:MFS transporter [Micromonospora wenchangensis]|uniref:MFS transporter n=1 Tax=Micromonospora wenchangensis TaxID=1185415 RepID=UPI0037F3B50A